MSDRRRAAVAALGVVTALSVLLPASAQQRPGPPTSPSRGHEQHGTPKGWKFTWPKGDPTKGRAVFVKLECYSCHEVRGEKFPAPTERAKLGPELSFMGPLHEADYFAEAIINPSAVTEKGKGYQAPDGSSKMPSFNESMTVQEAIDLVAFLRSLKSVAGRPGGHVDH